MSTQQINARSQAAQGVLSITRPQAGDQFVYEATEGLRIALDFPVDAATLSQDGNNLVFAFPDGGQVVLTDFFAQYGSAGAPSFVLRGRNCPAKPSSPPSMPTCCLRQVRGLAVRLVVALATTSQTPATSSIR